MSSHFKKPGLTIDPALTPGLRCWCGGTLGAFCHPGYKQCEECGTLVALAPRSDEELKQFYCQSHYWETYQQQVGNYPDIQVRSYSDFEDRIPAWYNTLIRYKTDFNAILELGCSHGGFLDYCRSHGTSTVVGVEVDAATCAFAKERFNLPFVVSGLFPDVDLPIEHFDVVCGFDVIEHFTDPVRGVQRMADLLDEDGVIFVQTPCYQGEDSSWSHLKPDEHLFLFSPVALQRLFAICGLEVIALTPGYFSGDCFVLARKLSIKSILFVRTDTIGDSILASSILPSLKTAYPDARVTVLCQQHIAELYESSPYVHNTIPFNFTKAYEHEAYRNIICLKLRAIQPDLVLNSLYSRELLNEYFTLASGGKQIVGMYGDISEISQQTRDANNSLYTWLIPSPGSNKTELERHADFVRGLGLKPGTMAPVVWTTEDDERFADEFLQSHNLQGNKTIALFPAGRHWQKYYPRYAEALNPICADKGYEILLLGGMQDRMVLAELSAKFSIRTICSDGTLTLRQLAAVLKRCRLAVGADTGTAHIACAVGTPAIVILWGGHFGRFFPYSPLTTVVCLPLACYGCNWQCRYKRWHCVTDINPTVLATAVAGVLASPSAVPRVYLQSPQAWSPSDNEPEWEMFEQFVDYRRIAIIPVG